MEEAEDDLMRSLWEAETDNRNGTHDSEEDDEEDGEGLPVSEGKNNTTKKGRARAPPRKKRTYKPQPRQNKLVCTVQSCKYSTAYPKDLTRHMRKHTGEKPFICDICNKSFSRNDKLVGHKRTHDLDGVKPNKCNLCEYASFDAGSLRKHIRVHSDERPYKCKMCSYQARDSSQLIVHLRHHTGDSPYTCTYKNCKAAFKTPSDLSRHSRLHSGDKPYACSHCDYRAAVKCNLNAHIKKYHNNESSCNSNVPSQTSEESSGVAVLKGTDGSSSKSVGKLIYRNKSKIDALDFMFACKLCDYKGETIKHFQQHMRRKHKVAKKVIVPDTIIMPPPKKRNMKEYLKIFSCSTCSASFVMEESLRCHMKQHGSLGPPCVPMPILTIDSPQVKNSTLYEAEEIVPYSSNLIQTEQEYLGHVQEEIVESVHVRPHVITFADRIYTEN